VQPPFEVGGPIALRKELREVQGQIVLPLEEQYPHGILNNRVVVSVLENQSDPSSTPMGEEVGLQVVRQW
jgi:hypothetical protein